VFGLDIAAHEEAVDAVADAEVVAILELVHGGGHVGDGGAVGALQVDGVVAIGAGLNAGVAARHGGIGDADLAVVGAADDERAVVERITRAHARPGGVNVHQAGAAVRDRNGTFRRRDPGFGNFFHRPALTAHGGATAFRE